MSDVTETRDTAHCDIGIVCALKREVAPFLARCDRVRKYTGGRYVFRGGLLGELRIAVVETGAGRAHARKAAQALIDAHSPDWILSCGFSGALRPELKIGHIVVADSVADLSGEVLHVELKMPPDPAHGLHVGRIVTAGSIVRTIAEKQSIARQTGGLAVDMESLSVAQVCRDAKTRFLAVRAISDDLSADLPAELMSVFGASGSIRAGAIAGALWKRPSSATDMLKLREQAVHAADKLALFLEGVVAQLPLSSGPGKPESAGNSA